MSSDFDFGGAVPPWGRSAAEYEAFFALSDVAPSARILDCGGGPSSFAAEWSRNGRYVVAVDPIYRFSARDFLADFDSTATQMLAGMRKARDRFKWDYYGSPEMSSNAGVTSSRPSLPIFRQRLGVVATYLPAYRNCLSCRNPSILYFVLIYYFSTLPNSTQKCTSPSCGKCFA